MSTTMSRKDWILYIVGGLFVLMILYNMFFRDYTQETKNYLTSIGRKDAIDKVVPKTYDDVIHERMKKELLFDQLLTNVTKLNDEVKYLRYEIQQLKQNQQTSQQQSTQNQASS